MCMAYAKVEQKLGEIDRARAVLTHGSQFADPRRATAFWQASEISLHDLDCMYLRSTNFFFSLPNSCFLFGIQM